VRTSVITLCLLAFAAAGCGGAGSSAEDFDGEQQAVAEVVEDLQKAATDDEPRKICDQILARSLTRQTTDCPKAVDEALKDADLYELEVTKVDPANITASTRTATATVESGRDGDQVEKITLVREGTAWKISQLAGR
jgi:hypothetical protein